MDVQPSQLVAAAGSAIVSAARLGRLLSRSGWRVARQLPGAQAVEREAQRLQQVAANEARRLLQTPDAPAARPSPGRPLPGRPSPGRPLPGRPPAGATPEEQRAADLIRRTDGAEPLRIAMSELLERSVEATRTDSREYLYGTIISQLVPDEARIIAALAGAAHYPAADVVQRSRGRRGTAQVLVANASTVGRAAGVVNPDGVPTYLTRLHGFGLVEFGEADDALSVQYDILATDNTVQAARRAADKRRRGAVRLARKTVRLSTFGREFWASTDPSRAALEAPPG